MMTAAKPSMHGPTTLQQCSIKAEQKCLSWRPPPPSSSNTLSMAGEDMVKWKLIRLTTGQAKSLHIDQKTMDCKELSTAPLRKTRDLLVVTKLLTTYWKSHCNQLENLKWQLLHFEIDVQVNGCTTTIEEISSSQIKKMLTSEQLLSLLMYN